MIRLTEILLIFAAQTIAMARFINPFTDIGFKRIFGQELSKPLLIDFLNSLLEGEHHITNLAFKDKEYPPLYGEGRTIIYDVYCETDTGERIIVEMQNRLRSNFKDRTLFYAAEAISRQGEKGKDWDYDVKAVYLVAFINDVWQNVIPCYFRIDVKLMDIKRYTVFSDKLRMIYIQLPLFTKEVDECEDNFDRWIYVLKHMDTLPRLPFAVNSAVFKRLEEISDLTELTREERMKYDTAIRQYRDTLNMFKDEKERGRAEGLAEGRAEGHAEGRAEGHAEGHAEAMLSVVRNMKAAGLGVGVIQQATGLSPEVIARME